MQKKKNAARSSEPMFILKIVLFHILFIIRTWLKVICVKGTWSLLCGNILLPQQSRTTHDSNLHGPETTSEETRWQPIQEGSRGNTATQNKVPPQISESNAICILEMHLYSALKLNWRVLGDANHFYALKCHDPGTRWWGIFWVWSVHCWSKAFIFSTNLWLRWTSF